MKRTLDLGLGLGCAITLCAALAAPNVLAAPARTPSAAALQRLDTDHDGTVDMNEANTAASAVFDRLDRDHEGTLDRRELRGRMSGRQFAAAVTDHGKTMSRDEYMAAVDKLFATADSDHDGTLDLKELNSAAGRAFLRLTT
jgi:Ca2+-binding EF-hand superfamily protein